MVKVLKFLRGLVHWYQNERWLSQVGGYFVIHDKEHNSDEHIDHKRHEHIVGPLGPGLQLGIALVLARVAVIEQPQLVLGHENDGQVDEDGEAPDEQDELERARLCHDRLYFERLTDGEVALTRDQQQRENGRDAHTVLDEPDQVAHELAHVPALLGEHVVEGRGHAREQHHHVGDGQVGEQKVGEAAQLLLLHQHVYDRHVAECAE